MWDKIGDILLKLADRPEVGIFGVMAIIELGIIVKLMLMLDRSRNRNIELTADIKRAQENAISTLQDNAKVLEGIKAAMNAISKSFDGVQTWLQVLVAGNRGEKS